MVTSKVHIPLYFVLFLALGSCKSSTDPSNCILLCENAVDMYNYPILSNKNDTDIFVYQLRGILDQRDSFTYVQSGNAYLKNFNEPNLSLRYLGTETFRFTYSPWGGTPINISFNKEELTVKYGVQGSIYPITNYGKLDSIEQQHLRYMERNFFRKSDPLHDQKNRYHDSVVRKYPDLNSIHYYKKLYDKSIDYDSLKFTYKEKTIKLSIQQYCNFIDSLNKTRFITLPWKVDYPETVTDGGGYTFEANTKTKYKFFVCYGLPIDSLPITRFCQYLIDFSNIDKRIILSSSF